MAGLPERPLANTLDNEVCIETADNRCNGPCTDSRNPAVDEATHLGRGAREMHQGDDGKDQSEGQNDLTENKQTPRAVVAPDSRDNGSWYNGDRPGDEASKPRLDSNSEEPLHDDLARQCANDG